MVTELECMNTTIQDFGVAMLLSHMFVYAALREGWSPDERFMNR